MQKMRFKHLVLLLIAPFAVLPLSQTRSQYLNRLQNPLLVPQISSPPMESTTTPGDSNTVILSDVLGGDKTINIFAGFTRDFAPISARFEDSTQNTTILAPINSAIMSLPRKPWEDKEGSGEDEERAKHNLMRFVEAHVLPVSPWKVGEKVDALYGGQVWWEEKGGKRVVQPGDIEVVAIASTVYNGEVWILKGVRNYA